LSHAARRILATRALTPVSLHAGLGAALGAVGTSGLAGVMCERLLKGGSRDVSMSIRNVQLGAPGFLLGIAAMHLQDSEEHEQRAVFRGYTHWTWAVVVLHSLGQIHARVCNVRKS